ncbi:unnamed protein product [Clonostachys rosea]|uniref:Xaa-Pro dipeptidyl-peptidase C-terminal domain-containing protein n=1 Tax=Bionectria ochroleuca TaxID=29856 RepID=A0ABY6TZR7_BIOOC|nr:unnamed protein product [Clonostachys rosea]
MNSIEGIDIIFRPANHDLSKRWLDLDPSTRVLEKGWTKAPGRRPLPEDLLFEKDAKIQLRDGANIWADIFRPVSAGEEHPVPALLAWSPYGKNGNGFQSLNAVPFRAGVPKSWTSDLEKFEAPDPAEWCPRGYAIVNVDPRGVGDSDGDIYFNGTQEGRDGHDTVEWIAKQSWCNGAVGLVGNSWLAISQWLIAAEKPPHLKAIAPWEGLSDVYRELLCRGGIPNSSFFDFRSKGYCGKNGLEDLGAMIRKHPLPNAYWKDKRARVEDIDVPMYALASFSSGLHTEGSLRGFLFSASKEKWLRIHHTQEWHDLYQKSSNDDLQKFLDKYLVGKDNGWEKTPTVRHSLLGYNIPCVINRPDVTYPPPSIRHTTLYVSCSTSTLQSSPEGHNSTSQYQSDSWDDDGAHFTYKFSSYTELIGYSRAILYMSCADTDEMDVYVIIRKLDAQGNELLHLNIPLEDLPAEVKEADVPHGNIFKYVGPNGRLRASKREFLEHEPRLTPEQSKALYPAEIWHPLDQEEKIRPGEVVRLEIPLWPSGIIFQTGESMRLEVKGHEVALPEFPALDRVPTNLNRGMHVIHSGPEYPSSLIVPLSQGGATGQ